MVEAIHVDDSVRSLSLILTDDTRIEIKFIDDITVKITNCKNDITGKIYKFNKTVNVGYKSYDKQFEIHLDNIPFMTFQLKDIDSNQYNTSEIIEFKIIDMDTYLEELVPLLTPSDFAKIDDLLDD